MHQNHFTGGSGRDVFVRRFRHLHDVPVALGVDPVSVKKIDDGISPIGLFAVARREVDDHVAIGRIAFEISLQRLSVNLDMLHGAGASLAWPYKQTAKQSVSAAQSADFISTLPPEQILSLADYFPPFSCEYTMLTNRSALVPAPAGNNPPGTFAS